MYKKSLIFLGVYFIGVLTPIGYKFLSNLNEFTEREIDLKHYFYLKNVKDYIKDYERSFLKSPSNLEGYFKRHNIQYQCDTDEMNVNAENNGYNLIDCSVNNSEFKSQHYYTDKDYKLYYKTKNNSFELFLEKHIKDDETYNGIIFTEGKYVYIN